MIVPEFSFFGTEQVPKHHEVLNLLESIRHKPNVDVDTSERSREGRELLFCAIGCGSKVIGVTAGAHADEPVGIATAFNLIRELTFSSRYSELLTRFTFVVFPMLDPDGSALNEEWSHDLSYESYFLNHYRNNQPSEDCEHGIPISNEQEIRPEVAFFKKHIDRYRGRIEYYVTLHTTHVLGGSLFVVDPDFQNQQIISSLTQLCQTRQLCVWDYQPQDDPSLSYIAPGFIGAPSIESYSQKYQYAPQILKMLKMSTYEYVLRKCGGKFGLISELPMFVPGEDFASLEETDVPLRDLKQRGLEIDRAVHQQRLKDLDLIARFAPSNRNPWYQSALFTAKMAPTGIANAESMLAMYDKKNAKRCDVETMARLTPIENELKRHRLFIKCLEENQNATLIVKEHRDGFHSLFEKYESTIQLTEVPIKKQLEIQTALILQGVHC